MSVWSVLRHSVVPERQAEYEEKVSKLAERARKAPDALHWQGYDVAMGRLGEFYYVSRVADFAALDRQGTSRELVLRLLGEKEGARWLQEVSACLAHGEQTISIDRPELSFARGPQAMPMAMVTAIRVCPDGREAFEEFARKLAEAIPKIDDPSSLTTLQTLIGDLREYRLVRPIARIADLGKVMQAADLLTQAFGAAEGGLFFRTGTSAIEHAERRIVVLRADLSHPEA